MRFLLLFACLASLSAQPPAPEAPPRPEGAPPPPPAAAAGANGQQRPRRPPPEPKNLKVLKVQPTELIPTMRNWSASLGVQCGFCHVQGDFASDEKPNKELARKMYTMVQDINTRYADAKVNVGCYTCHRGKTEPEVNPPAQAEGARPGGPAGAPGAPGAAAPPAAPAPPPPPQQ